MIGLKEDKMSSKKVAYVAGPMRGFENYNFDAFFVAEAKLKEKGFKVLNPASMDLKNDVDPAMFPKGFDWKNEPENIPISVFVLRDVKALCKCTHIYMLKGWRKSVGATAERAIAKWLKLEVVYER
jgi:hypothetical protein